MNNPLDKLGNENVVLLFLDDTSRLPLLKYFFAATKPLGFKTREARIKFLKLYFGDGVSSANDLTVGQIRSIHSLIKTITKG
jgi:hypothetical protein